MKKTIFNITCSLLFAAALQFAPIVTQADDSCNEQLTQLKNNLSAEQKKNIDLSRQLNTCRQKKKCQTEKSCKLEKWTGDKRRWRDGKAPKPLKDIHNWFQEIPGVSCRKDGYMRYADTKRGRQQHRLDSEFLQQMRSK